VVDGLARLFLFVAKQDSRKWRLAPSAVPAARSQHETAQPVPDEPFGLDAMWIMNDIL
jgi:hypothetical protein